MSRRFSEELIEEIKTANDIVSVISEYVPLKKKGKTYWGCCPFHNEKTPSFSVTPEKGFYYCFGCHAHGNVLNFLMEHEHYSFVEALEKLADRANIALPAFELSKEDQAKDAHRQELYKINEMAASFFHNCMTKTELGKAGLAYFRERGLTEETIKKFRLGFAPNAWDKLYTAFIKRGIKEDHLIELGLCRKGENGKVYDYFRNRVMFPIVDGKGRVVAFGGRVLDDSKPKYLNSPETLIFNKRRVLFGFDKAYRAVREKQQAILVEGYMDVISLHNRGITNVVASLGTAYTKEHGNLLVRQAQEIILAYDMDGAGQTAAMRAIELLQNTDFNVRVIAMPDGKDPDDFVRNHGPAEFLTLIDRAVRPFDFLLNKALLQQDTTNLKGKQAIMAELFPYIARTHSQVLRDDYLRALALPLYMDTNSIFKDFRRFQNKGEAIISQDSSVKEGDLPSVEKYTDEDRLVAMALTDLRSWQRVCQHIPLDYLRNSMHRTMLQKAGQVIEQNQKLNETLLAEVFDMAERQEYTRLMISGDTAYEESVLDRYIFSVALHSLQEQYKEHSMLADKLSRAGDPQFIVELKKCQDLQVLIKEWSKYTK